MIIILINLFTKDEYHNQQNIYKTKVVDYYVDDSQGCYRFDVKKRKKENKKIDQATRTESRLMLLGWLQWLLWQVRAHPRQVRAHPQQSTSK